VIIVGAGRRKGRNFRAGNGIAQGSLRTEAAAKQVILPGDEVARVSAGPVFDQQLILLPRATVPDQVVDEAGAHVWGGKIDHRRNEGSDDRVVREIDRASAVVAHVPKWTTV